MPPRLVGTIGLSWIGTIGATFFTHANAALGTVCAVVSLAASIYALRLARKRSTTETIRQAEETARLCAGCRMGMPPVECPILPRYRPADCPRRMTL